MFAKIYLSLSGGTVLDALIQPASVQVAADDDDLALSAALVLACPPRKAGGLDIEGVVHRLQHV